MADHLPDLWFEPVIPVMNPQGKSYEGSEKLKKHWRDRYRTDAPMTVKPPTQEERDCDCIRAPLGCERSKCPRRRP